MSKRKKSSEFSVDVAKQQAAKSSLKNFGVSRPGRDETQGFKPADLWGAGDDGASDAESSTTTSEASRIQPSVPESGPGAQQASPEATPQEFQQQQQQVDPLQSAPERPQTAPQNFEQTARNSEHARESQTAEVSPAQPKKRSKRQSVLQQVTGQALPSPTQPAAEKRPQIEFDLPSSNSPKTAMFEIPKFADNPAAAAAISPPAADQRAGTVEMEIPVLDVVEVSVAPEQIKRTMEMENPPAMASEEQIQHIEPIAEFTTMAESLVLNKTEESSQAQQEFAQSTFSIEIVDPRQAAVDAFGAYVTSVQAVIEPQQNYTEPAATEQYLSQPPQGFEEADKGFVQPQYIEPQYVEQQYVEAELQEYVPEHHPYSEQHPLRQTPQQPESQPAAFVDPQLQSSQPHIEPQYFQPHHNDEQQPNAEFQFTETPPSQPWVEPDARPAADQYPGLEPPYTQTKTVDAASQAYVHPAQESAQQQAYTHPIQDSVEPVHVYVEPLNSRVSEPVHIHVEPVIEPTRSFVEPLKPRDYTDVLAAARAEAQAPPVVEAMKTMELDRPTAVARGLRMRKATIVQEFDITKLLKETETQTQKVLNLEPEQKFDSAMHYFSAAAERMTYTAELRFRANYTPEQKKAQTAAPPPEASWNQVSDDASSGSNNTFGFKFLNDFEPPSTPLPAVPQRGSAFNMLDLIDEGYKTVQPNPTFAQTRGPGKVEVAVDWVNNGGRLPASREGLGGNLGGGTKPPANAFKKNWLKNK